MADSFSSYLANLYLNWLRGTAAPTAPVTIYVQLHTGAPGPAGTTNVSSVTTRVAITFAVASGGAVAMTGTAPSWANWAGTNGETLTDFTIWDALTGGNFLDSVQFSSSRTVFTGDTVTFASCSIAIPVAA